jgi:hypothetical protein
VVDASGSADIENDIIDYAETALDGSGSATATLLDSSQVDGAYGVGGTWSSLSVVGNNFSDLNSGVYVVMSGSSLPTVQNNATVGVIGGTAQAAYFLIDASVNLHLLTGNTASGDAIGVFGLFGSTVAVSSSWSSSQLPLEIEDTLDVPAGITLTLEPGTVVKGDGGPLTVEGTLDAVGTSADPITFTSINDNSVGGTTGTGSPAEGDWQGIVVDASGSADIENDINDYASTGINASTGQNVTIEGNMFSSNNVAVDVSAFYDVATLSGTNAAIHTNWFDGNVVSIDASSDWQPVDPACGYFPTISADGNYYGSSHSQTPPVSESDYAAIKLASGDETYPDGWPREVGQAPPGSADVIQGWSILPCILPDPLDPLGPPLAACSVVALPLSFDGAVSDVPVVCPDP